MLSFAKNLRRLALPTLLIMSVAPPSHAQRKHRPSSKATEKVAWRVFSPPDKSFNVEAPAKLRRIKDMFGDSDPNGYKVVDVYGGRLESKSFLVVALTPSEGARRVNPNGNDLGGLEFVIGGDNAKPLSEKEIVVDGLRGKEFTYTNSKGRIIGAGERIFILAFAGITEKDDSSSLIAKFFNSFKVLSKSRGASKGAPGNSFN